MRRMRHQINQHHSEQAIPFFSTSIIQFQISANYAATCTQHGRAQYQQYWYTLPKWCTRQTATNKLTSTDNDMCGLHRKTTCTHTYTV